MNGARTTFMRRGYLLTALAAAVLLAASPPEALAQITDIAVRSVRIDDANTAGVVAEGTSSNVTVSLNKAVPVGDTVTVTIGKIYPGGGAAGAPGNAEDAEIVVNTSVHIPGGSSYGSTPIIFGLDTDAVDEAFQISATAITIASTATPANAVDATNLPVNTPATGMIDDAQEQTYSLRSTDVPSTIKEGAATPFGFSLTAVPARPAGEPVTIHLAAPRGYTIAGVDNPATASAPANTVLDDSTPATGEAVTLAPPTNDRNRIDDVVALTAHLGTAVQSTQVAMAEVTVLDIHQLPASDAITADALDNERRDLGTAIESVMEGDTAYVWVAVINTAQDRVDDSEMFTVDVTGADPSQSLDYRITRPSGDRMTSGSARGTDRVGPWVIEVHEDEDVGMENLMLSLDVEGTTANGGGSSSGSFSLAIEDNTEKKVWPLPEADAYPAITDAMDAAAGDDGLNPGESFTVMTSDLFGLAEGYTAAYAASVEGGAVSVSASGDSVTVNAVSAGESKVTVTATAKMASSSFQAEQTVSNVASITFPVEVVDRPVPPVEDLTLMLEMPSGVMNGNVVEGQSYNIPVVLNRAVTEDEGSVEVTFARDRSQSDADEDDYSISGVTIAAGEDSAMAELMITEDMMDDAGHASGEQLVIYAMAGDLQSNDLTFTLWDEAVPALPLIGQLVLALFLALGGARLYRRRQS